jgi:DNA-binding GntR family transcriptional regulator
VSRIAEELGTSLTPIREALRLLERDGLVEMVPHKGAVLRELTPKEFEDIFTIRGILEGLAVRMACPRLIQGDVERLEHILQCGRSNLLSGDAEAWLETDEQFHKFIIQRCDNEFLKQMLASIFERIRRLWLLTVNIHDGQRAIAEHQAVLAALKERDANQAEKRMIEHIERTLYVSKSKLLD